MLDVVASGCATDPAEDGEDFQVEDGFENETLGHAAEQEAHNEEVVDENGKLVVVRYQWTFYSFPHGTVSVCDLKPLNQLVGQSKPEHKDTGGGGRTSQSRGAKCVKRKESVILSPVVQWSPPLNV